MTIEQYLKQVKEREAKATSGPWEVYCAFGSSDLPCSIVKETGRTVNIAGVECDDNDQICDVHPDAKNPTPDFRFIAHARTDIPKLVRMVEILVDCLEFELACVADDMTSVKMTRDQTIMGRALMDCEKVGNNGA